MKRWQIGLLIAAAAMALIAAFWLTGNSADQAPGVADESATTTEVAVTVAPILRTTLHAYVNGWGVIEPEPPLEGRPPAGASIAAPVAGLIAAVPASEGQYVRAGATLVRLDTRVADVAVQRSQEAVRYAEQALQRQEQLGPGQATSMRAYQDAQQQLAAARSELARTEAERGLLEVKAPFSGMIVRNNARLGQPVDPSTVLIELIDLDRLVVTVSVRSADIARVKRGQRLELSPGGGPNAAPSESLAGNLFATKVDYIGSQVIAASDTVIVRGRVPASNGLRPGQFVDARILVDERPNSLAVPVDSVVQGGNGPEIAVVEGNTAVKRPVTTGIREGTQIEVSGEGLQEGMSVVVQGAYGLPERSQIRIVGQ